MSSIQERRTALTGESHYEVIEYGTGTINTQSNRKILPLSPPRGTLNGGAVYRCCTPGT
ncbi:hypothetical protein DPMN_014292 [Dreissena polymorpha]|uniref:Uncharacterized protein n=1 Tax=Dreissena polymorpha TaxID=45954 RepID=A0A9D4S2K7_DREPO|nr:hypothetical protein DPMN_014292 [Dreissena polymorpha]